MDIASPGTDSSPATPSTGDPDTPTRIDIMGIGLLVAAVTMLRFVTTSPLWLDEALSVNIATLPVRDLLEALRHDGHPPLYYLVLHSWMELFGDGDSSVRAISGLVSVATLPLAWIAGRRRAGTAGAWGVVLVMAIAPYSLRYATEARMYAMASLFALAAWLVADDLRKSPDRARWILLAVLTGALLLTHYWAIYLGAAAVALLGWRWFRSGAREEAIRVGSALAAGAVLFLPWLPSFVYQAGHTGTPWGTATRPTSAVVELAVGLGGGGHAEGFLFGFGLLALSGVGLTFVRSADTQVVLDVRTTPTVRPEMALLAATMVIGLAAGLASNATFVARYAAVVTPLLFIAAGVGLARLPAPWPRRLFASTLVVAAGVGAVYNVIDDRTQGAVVADVINAEAESGDLVVFCPDQLGPSTLRGLDPEIAAVAVPTLERPTRIDWVDYADRNRSADPEAITAAILELADGNTIWLVDGPTYRTYEDLCPAVRAGLSAARPDLSIPVVVDGEIFEPAMLTRMNP